ncbi:MAG: hypothetical protein ACE15F_17095 [bacterium]
MRLKKPSVLELWIMLAVWALALAYALPRFIDAQLRGQILSRQRELQALADQMVRFEAFHFPRGLHPLTSSGQNFRSDGFATLTASVFEKVGYPIPEYPVIHFYSYAVHATETPAEVPACTITFAVGAPAPPLSPLPQPSVTASMAAGQQARKSVLDFFRPYDISNGIHSQGDLMVAWSSLEIAERISNPIKEE